MENIYYSMELEPSRCAECSEGIYLVCVTQIIQRQSEDKQAEAGERTKVFQQDCACAWVKGAEQVFNTCNISICDHMGQLPGVPIKVPVKHKICFCEIWHAQKEKIKNCFMNNAEQICLLVIANDTRHWE